MTSFDETLQSELKSENQQQTQQIQPYHTRSEGDCEDLYKDIYETFYRDIDGIDIDCGDETKIEENDNQEIELDEPHKVLKKSKLFYSSSPVDMNLNMFENNIDDENNNNKIDNLNQNNNNKNKNNKNKKNKKIKEIKEKETRKERISKKQRRSEYSFQPQQYYAGFVGCNVLLFCDLLFIH